jgi:uncharacterized membrane protein YhaH (DUF805 family)
MLRAQYWLSFEGRITRRDYWMRLVVPVVLISLIVAVVSPPLAFGEAFLVWTLVAAWPTTALAARRCHDRNRSGWFQLVWLIPWVGPLWLLIELGFLRGTVGPNRFGPDPLPQKS